MSRKIRQHPRVRPRQLSAFIDLNGKPLGPYVVENISLGGALLRTPEVAELEGDALFVVLLAGPSCPRGVRAFARLVAAVKTPPALRIEWPHLDPHSKNELVRVLEDSGLGRQLASQSGPRPSPNEAAASEPKRTSEGAPALLEECPTVLGGSSGAASRKRAQAGEVPKGTAPPLAAPCVGSVPSPVPARACAPSRPACPAPSAMPEQPREALIAKIQALEARLAEANAKISAQEAEIRKLSTSLRSK